MFTTSTTAGIPENRNTLLHVTDKSNWRIVQLSNGYYQTEVSNPLDVDTWIDVTRRASIEEAEAAIDSSIEFFSGKLADLCDTQVVKTFKK